MKEIEIVGITIYNKKAYIIVNAKVEGGGYLQVEPCYISNLTLEEIIHNLNKVIVKGHPKHPPLKPGFFKTYKDPLLNATKLKSWKAVAKESAAYTLVWQEDKIILYLHALDEKGRFTTKQDRTMNFPIETDLKYIVKIILDDVKKIPNVEI